MLASRFPPRSRCSSKINATLKLSIPTADITIRCMPGGRPCPGSARFHVVNTQASNADSGSEGDGRAGHLALVRGLERLVDLTERIRVAQDPVPGVLLTRPG